jgi:hypothetical protein
MHAQSQFFDEADADARSVREAWLAIVQMDGMQQ